MNKSNDIKLPESVPFTNEHLEIIDILCKKYYETFMVRSEPNLRLSDEERRIKFSDLITEQAKKQIICDDAYNTELNWRIAHYNNLISDSFKN